jgi:hypothetical protein
MRAREFIKENASAGATASGSVAAVAQPVGSVISRLQSPKPAKYRNTYKGSKPDARR